MLFVIISIVVKIQNKD